MACSRRSFLKRGSQAAAVGASLPWLTAAEANRRQPNIIFIMSDELGYYELSCMRHPHIVTPNIDRMAAEGIRFTQALAGSALCAPTRCCLLTGKHSGHTSVRTNGGGTPMREGEETIGSVLKQAGYATGGFGKWGCGGRGSTGVPERHGFDVFLGYYDQVHAHSYYPPYLVRNSEEFPLEGNHGGRKGKTYSHTVIWNAGMQFIRDHRDSPFFCYMPVTPPHGMFDIPASDPAWAFYQDRDWPLNAKRYAAMVTMVDRQVGELLDLLKSLNLDENTLVIFCGDNGGMDYFRDKDHPRGFHAPNVNPLDGQAFRGQKGNLYEGGLRIPMVMRWPGHIQPGQVSDLLWYFPDILPTVAELAGAEVPDDVDGMSIVPELVGAAAAGRSQPRHDFLYWELGGQVAVRRGAWKAIRPGSKAPWELYNLDTDIGETTNLAEQRPALLAEMKKIAEQAHEPAVVGKFFDRSLEDKDRRAKWGDSLPRTTVHTLSRAGLLPLKSMKVVRVSSESAFNGKLAVRAVDGNPRTLWHTKWKGTPVGPPHELVLDLGRPRTIEGFRYLPRQDISWNGTIKDCELYVSDTPDGFSEPVIRAQFAKKRTPQEAKCDQPVRGRYVKLRILSEVNGGPWASIAELGIIGK